MSKKHLPVPDRIVDAKERRKIIPYSDVHVGRLERDGRFPKRIHLGPHRVGWRLSALMNWIEAREREGNLGADHDPDGEAA